MSCGLLVAVVSAVGCMIFEQKKTYNKYKICVFSWEINGMEKLKPRTDCNTSNHSFNVKVEKKEKAIQVLVAYIFRYSAVQR